MDTHEDGEHGYARVPTRNLCVVPRIASSHPGFGLYFFLTFVYNRRVEIARGAVLIGLDIEQE